MKLIKKLVLVCCCLFFFSALSAQNALENWNTVTTELKQISETYQGTTISDSDFKRYFVSTPSNLKYWEELNAYRLQNSISVSAVTNTYLSRVIEGMNTKTKQ